MSPSARAEPEAPPAPTWYRYELVPGVELHVRADAQERHRGLVEHLLALVRRQSR